jgi:hypothetical protein
MSPLICPRCQGTGKSPGSDYLDCTHCEAASQIAMRSDALYPAYKVPIGGCSANYLCSGKEDFARLHAEIDALVEAARTMWGWAIQVGEQFDRHPDNDKERADWRMQCDAVQALLKNYPRRTK